MFSILNVGLHCVCDLNLLSGFEGREAKVWASGATEGIAEIALKVKVTSLSRSDKKVE